MDTELSIQHQVQPTEANGNPPSNADSPFIEANTISSSLGDIAEHHIIPVFVKDNEPLISSAEFIERAKGIVEHVFEGETILEPSVRISHPVKGRIPSAKGKPADQLEEHEKTLYYERLAFVIQIPSITNQIEGDPLSLTVGGVKAYNLDNMNSKKGSPEHFKICIGFINKICTNLCIWGKGFSKTIEVTSARELEGRIYNLITEFDIGLCLKELEKYNNFMLSEEQFAQLIGRARLYQYLPSKQKKQLPELSLNDTQVATVAKQYYSDEHFGRSSDGSITLWDLYNLFTGANKSSYIDTFVDRSVNATQFTAHIAKALEEDTDCWFLN